MDFASVFRFNNRVINLEKDVAELKNDLLPTQVTVLVDDCLNTRIGATREEFMNFLSVSLTDRITEQVRNQLPQILPEEVSNFTPPVIEKMIHESLNQDKDEGPSAGSGRGLKKQKTNKDIEKTISPKTKYSSSKSSKGTKSQPKSFGKSVHVEEPEFEVGDTNTPQGQEGDQEPTDPDWNEDKTLQIGPTQNWLMTLAASTSTGKSLKEFDELMSISIDFSSYILNGLKIKNQTQEILLGPAFRLLKGTRSNYAELEYDFKECYKALSEKLDWENPEGRISTMTYTMSTSKTKAAQYDLPGIEDMRKTFYAYARGIQSRGDVYSTKRILAVTQVSVMRKHGYGYLEEIVNRLTNLLGDDVPDFAIALRMFTRSLVIPKLYQGGRLYQTDLRLLQ
uniref:Uncharacterized protein n=1 Tax=Tanacetum cinerariifolium TaxID=118510 RepID=A0A699I5I6_TANCI|nr:hypothetical protein [Tanacetum cinerariifolium]